MNRNLILTALSLMTWGVGEGMFYYFQPVYLEQLGADPLKIGAILGLVGVAMTLAYLPAGYLSDRVGRRPLLRLAWVMGALATLLMAASGRIQIVVLGMLVYGMTAFVTVPLNSYVAAARGSLSVGRALTLLSAAFNFGAFLGPLVGGWVGKAYGLRATFQIAAVIFVFSTAILFLIEAQPVETEASAPDQPSSGWRKLRYQMSQVLNGPFPAFLGLIFLATFGMYLQFPLTQNFLLNERGLDLAQVGQLISARYLGIVLLNLVLGHFNPRLGFTLAQLSCALSSLLLWRGQVFPLYLGAYAAMGGYNTGRSLLAAQARSLAPSARIGLAYGLMETVNALVLVLAPPLAGWLYAIQPGLIFPTSLALISLGLAANLWFLSLRRPDPALSEV